MGSTAVAGAGSGIESRCDALYLFPRNDMAAGLDCAVWLNAVDGVWAEVDGVSIADVGLTRLADLADESQGALGVGDGKTRTPAGHHFIADRCAASRERRRDSRSTVRLAIW